MGTAGDFLSKFGGGAETEEVSLPSTMLSAGAPNALGAFMDKFSTMSDSYFFYNDTVELRFDSEAHQYFLVEELGNLIPVKNVTTILHVIDKSFALVPWAVKVAAQELLRKIPLAQVQDEFGSIMLAPITLEDFTKLVMEAKDTHKRVLTDAGDLGHLAHKCLEDSIQHAIDHTGGNVAELRNLPTDEKALACAQAAFAWMQQHKVRWLKTEQKIYSREYGYAGTMDGKCLVSSCDDRSCCTEHFEDALSIADWKSSNALRLEYVFQVAGAYEHAEREEYGENIQYCFILRLGKNEEEAGKFEPWPIPAKDFPEAFAGFLACLELTKLIDSVSARMSARKKGVRAVKKQMKAEEKEIAKMKAKVEKAAAKAQLKLDRAAEKERIKADAKKAREEAKLAKSNNGSSGDSSTSGANHVPSSVESDRLVSQGQQGAPIVLKETNGQLERPKPDHEVPGEAEDTSDVTLVDAPVNEVAEVPAETILHHGEQPRAEGNNAPPEYEETPVERKPFVVPEEG
jgi:hypothetical protein